MLNNMRSEGRDDGIINGRVSFWLDQLGDVTRRPGLNGSLTADVCIVGAGLTGLWTAYYLKKSVPHLDIVILEQEFAGYGASGRNGGWVSAFLPGDPARYAKAHGRSSVIEFQQQMNATVDEVVDICRKEGVEADLLKSGNLSVATSQAQLKRLTSEFQRGSEWGRNDNVFLDPKELSERVRIPDALGAMFTPHCARAHPAKLVRGLAECVERAGVRIFEGTRVTEIEPRKAVTSAGVVSASYVLRATEGFTAGLSGQRRQWLPMNSSMIVTEPLDDRAWQQIGWNGAEAIGDRAHGYFYAQRTADNRIALGGRGIPYRFGSRPDVDGRTQEWTVAALKSVLEKHFPAAAYAGVEHAWCGVLGVPRDWCASVGLDSETGLGWAGGYVGHGVASTNLAGRTLHDLVLGNDTTLTRLPWVDRKVMPWEPEPLRWLGVRSMYALYRWSDRRETNGGLAATSRIARAADIITRRP